MIPLSLASALHFWKAALERLLPALQRAPGFDTIARNDWLWAPSVFALALLAAMSKWFIVPLVAVGIAQAVMFPRAVAIWGGAVAGAWCVLIWLGTGFLAVDPGSWVHLARKWTANEVIGWWLPLSCFTAVALSLAFPRAGALRLELSISRGNARNIRLFFISWILIALPSKFMLGEGTFFIRICLFLGALIVSAFFRIALDQLKGMVVKSAKDTVIVSAERQSSSPERVQAVRVASVIREVEAPVAAPAFQSAERIISVGSNEAKIFDAEDVSRAQAEINAALGDDRPWPHASLDLREGIPQRDLHALFAGSSEDEFEDGDDPYGLLRHLYDPSQAPDLDEEPIATAAPVDPVAVPAFLGVESVEFVDEEDPDDLSAEGMVDAIAAGAADIDVEAEVFGSVQPTADLSEPKVVENPVAQFEIADEMPESSEEVAVRVTASKAMRVIAVFKRLKADDRLESEFAGRLLPLIDESIETALYETEDGRDLLELRSGFLAATAFDDGSSDPVEPEIDPAVVQTESEADPTAFDHAFEVPDVVEPVEDALLPSASDTTSEDAPLPLVSDATDAAVPSDEAHSDAPEPDPNAAEVDEGAPQEGAAVDDDFQAPATSENAAKEPTEMLAELPQVTTATPQENPIAASAVAAVSIADDAEFVRLKEWLAIEPLPVHDIDRVLDERGRERPDDQEVDYTLRRLKEYAPSPSTRRNALRQMSSILSKDDENFSADEVALIKGIISAGSDVTLERWGFQSAQDANRKIVFLLFHDLVSKMVGDMEQRLKDGFSDLAAVTAYRGLGAFMEDLQIVFPQLAGMAQDFMALLDRAEYDFAFAGRQDLNLLVEGGLVDSVPRGSPGASVNVGVSRLLASRMPASAQEALSRFISIGKLIEPIDLMIIDEGVRSGEAPEKHPMHPMLMELQYRGLLEIRVLLDELKRRPQLRAEIPSIIKTRQEDLGARYEAIVRNQDEIERTVLRNREEATQLERLNLSVAALTSDLAERDRLLHECEDAARKLPVMDALVSAARQLVERDGRMSLVGSSRLKAPVAGGEMAVVLIHGHGMSWQVVDGTKLATGDGAMEIDLLKLCASVRNSQGFSDEGVTRLRIVMVAGEVGRLSHGCVFSIDEAMNDPARLFGPSELDSAAGRALGF